MVVLCSSPPLPSLIFFGSCCRPSLHKSVQARSYSSSKCEITENLGKNRGESFCSDRFCCCGRRRFIEAASIALIPVSSSNAFEQQSDYMAAFNMVHPPRLDWYDEFFAWSMDTGMKSYEAEIAGYKSLLFTNLKGKAKKVLEIGIGTGPNLKYYASDAGVYVFGVDPNIKMEKYAKAAAVAAGLPLTSFNFMQSVGEALPLSDASVDAVVGTLVLCSVKDVNMTLKEIKRVLKPGGLYLFVEHVAANDGSIARILQDVFDPLQQAIADGCHLTRKTGENIVEAGFSDVDIRTTYVSTLPHVYGIACK